MILCGCETLASQSALRRLLSDEATAVIETHEAECSEERTSQEKKNISL
jgi:hypothetical protein